MHSYDIAVGDVSGLDVAADAAAVDDGAVSTGHDPVRIGAEVAEVRLGHADKALLGILRVIYGKVNIGVRDDLVHEPVELLLNVRDVFTYAVVIEKLNVELSVGGYRQAADVLKLCAGGGENDILAVLVLHKLLFDDGVGVPVEHDVNAGGVVYDIRRSPRLAVLLYPKVRQRYDIVRTLLARCVDRRLDCRVHEFARLILTEGEYPFALLILEVRGS